MLDTCRKRLLIARLALLLPVEVRNKTYKKIYLKDPFSLMIMYYDISNSNMPNTY